jgi:hypothetical protein
VQDYALDRIELSLHGVWLRATLKNKEPADTKQLMMREF